MPRVNSTGCPTSRAELVRLKVDIIVAVTTHAAAAAKNATGTIPIVVISLANPVEQGLVASLPRPGGNVTGLSYSVDLQLFGKQLELLKEVVPKIRLVAILSNPANPFHAFAIRDVKGAARSLGLQLQFQEARGPAEFDGAFAAIAKERVEALVVVPDSMFQLHRTRLADLAARSLLPAAYGAREYAEAGGFMSYGPSLPDIFRRAAALRGHDAEGRQARREDARADGPVVAAPTGGPGYRVTSCCPTSRCNGPGARVARPPAAERARWADTDVQAPSGRD